MIKHVDFEEIKNGISDLSDDSPYSNILKNSFKGIQHFEKEKLKNKESKIRIHNELESGIIEADLLGKMIQGFQSTVEGAFNYVLGNGSNQGKVPRRFSDQSKLVVTAFSEGSFIISFNTRKDIVDSNQTKLFDNPHDELKEIVDGVLSDISKLEDYEEVSKFVDKYGIRTFNRSKQWVNSIKNNTFEYVTFNNYRLVFEESRIKDISSLMSKIKLSEESVFVDISGKLTMINNRTSKLSFETEEKEITVRVQDESIEKLNLVTNEQYKLKVNKVITKHSSGREVSEYLIKSLHGTSLDTKHN